MHHHNKSNEYGWQKGKEQALPERRVQNDPAFGAVQFTSYAPGPVKEI
jgi:hypothetical protein